MYSVKSTKGNFRIETYDGVEINDYVIVSDLFKLQRFIERQIGVNVAVAVIRHIYEDMQSRWDIYTWHFTRFGLIIQKL